MSKINHKRLIKLGRIMRSVKPENVEMSLIAKKPVCGSSGCALGHAAMNKDFRAEGLSLFLSKSEFSESVGLKFKNKYFDPDFFAEAGAEIFGITVRESQKLFEPSYGTGTEQKEEFLERFRSFMKSKNLHV